jgi:hypothetical protein
MRVKFVFFLEKEFFYRFLKYTSISYKFVQYRFCKGGPLRGGISITWFFITILPYFVKIPRS